MSARKIKNSWWVDFRYQGQRYRKRSPDNSKAGAVVYESILLNRLLKGEEIERKPEPTKKELSFTDFVWDWFETYVKVNNKPSTIQSKSSVIRNHLIPSFGKLKLKDITPDKIERFKALKKSVGLSNKTVNIHLSVLRTSLTFAHEWGHIDKVPPLKWLKLPPQPFKYFTEEEYTQLLRSSEGTPWHAMILCALHTGLRYGELCGLAWSDVNLDKKEIAVRHSMVNGQLGSPKSNKVRYIPITQELYEALSAEKKKQGYVFTHKGSYVTTYVGYKALQKLCLKAGVKRVGWHALRHTFASTLVARGVPMRSVQVLLGHSTILMTERYAHLSPSSFHEAISVLDTVRESHTMYFGQPAGNPKQKTS